MGWDTQTALCLTIVCCVQVDLHIAELTVRETFDFAARVQGTGLKAGDLPSPSLNRIKYY